ncbi:hypothetical protein T069G_07475 [Trichoderma breve]|uniref:P-loop containing nucleoside triphosphate hydrolase n=1 Tax=Trichoderma breve TaxID=2034170 RepID=A0A9W9B9P4_9HYPO|nr:hypothetical protein T069G_07475 [Trichoderma breve]KAJ4859208.1 hypothetical protein T069G_07475 [Trichoderma breve]
MSSGFTLTNNFPSWREIVNADPSWRDRVEADEVAASSRSSSVETDEVAATGTNLAAHLSLLSLDDSTEDAEELAGTPIFTQAVYEHASSLNTTTSKPFAQYGLLAGIIEDTSADRKTPTSAANDPRLFFNTSTPSSVFICGSQGSGKSHTLSCLLENCLTRSKANVLPHPLTGIVFHYDPWVSASGGSPCEAAYLASAEDISVRVLCAPTNIRDIKSIYSKLPNVSVEELRINQSDLNTKRMMDLMAVSSIQGGMPLYLHVAQRILRELRTEEQSNGTTFNYREFKRRLMDETLAVGQLQPLTQRLETLESFMVKEQVVSIGKKKALQSQGKGNNWESKAGQLTIVDLSCPCHKSNVGLVVALDEAHKYMTDTVESELLTARLLENIRVQRHVGIRVIISTQEPTISPKLLDLCSVTIVHKFTSPDWMKSLRQHLAGASIAPVATDEVIENGDGKITNLRPSSKELATELFHKIVALRRGEALLFCPSAIIGLRTAPIKLENHSSLIKLSHGHLKIQVRKRITEDGGRSILAV